jgi:curved DNA-binding protein CbpA
MMSTKTRPNFFLLLDLNPDAAWDEKVFAQRLRAKRIEWSRQSAGVASKALLARQNLALIEQIQTVMTDPAQRKQEAAAARAEHAVARAAEERHFERQLALLHAKEALIEQEIERFVVAFQHLYPPQEIRRRIEAGSGRSCIAPLHPPRPLEPSVVKSISDRLQFLHMRTLYELLQCSPQAATAELARAAEQLYTGLVKLPPDAELTAKIELAGLARDVFRSDELRARYDESLRREALQQILSELDESIGRANEARLYPGQVQLFLDIARKEGWDEQEALALLKEHAQQRKWILPASLAEPPSLAIIGRGDVQHEHLPPPQPQSEWNIRYHDLGSALRLRWTWPPDCQEVLITWSTQPCSHYDRAAITQRLRRSDYEERGYCDIGSSANHDCYILITVAPQDETQPAEEGVSLLVRRASRTIITYSIRAATMLRTRPVLHISIDAPALPITLPALLLVSKYREMPWRKEDGTTLLRIESASALHPNLLFHLPAISLPAGTFGKLFLEDETRYGEFVIHHPGKERMRLR